MCLQGQAHGMRLEHAIFHGPLAVDLDMSEAKTPNSYGIWPRGDGLPKKLRTWKVQTKNYPSIDVGLVSDPYGFEDSPDSEWISSGINSKGPESMAIGRQGNLFLWGFYAQPSDMTESARRVFVNSIAYMKQFDGVKPIVTTKSGNLGRDWAIAQATITRSTKMQSFYTENLEMLHQVRVKESDGSSTDELVFEVDEDLKTLRVGNRSPEFVPKLLERLEKNPADELCARLAQRYLAVAPSIEPTKLRAWYEENKPFLFFSDRAGYVWLVDETSKKAHARKR
jgi:hypothetical protein